MNFKKAARAETNKHLLTMLCMELSLISFLIRPHGLLARVAVRDDIELVAESKTPKEDPNLAVAKAGA
jgi:hypothetical protein